jgi:hypothetical protein
MTDPLFILSSAYNRDENTRAVLVAVHPRAAGVAAQLLPSKGYSQMGPVLEGLSVWAKETMWTPS